MPPNRLRHSHVPVETAHVLVRFDQRVFETLVVALSMIMMNEFGYRSSQRLLAEENHPIETFAFYRKNKPFHVSVQVRRTVRQANDSSSGIVDEFSKLRGELLVAVEDEETLAEQKAVERISEIAPDLHLKALSGPGVTPAT